MDLETIIQKLQEENQNSSGSSSWEGDDSRRLYDRSIATAITTDVSTKKAGKTPI